MAAAIRLEDLIKAQQKLKEDEAKKQTTETMSVEEFRKMAAEMSDTTPGTTTKSLIKKGLTDKNGEGLNANVIKLTKVIKDATAKKGNIIGPTSAADITPAGRVEKSTQDVEAARRVRMEGAIERRQPGGIGYLKDLFDVNQSTKGMAALREGMQKSFSKMFSLKGWFDLSEGKSQGLLGQTIRRKVAQNDYVEKRMESEPNLRTLKQYQGKGDDVIRRDIRAQFNRQQDTLGEAADNAKERARIEKTIAEGYDTPTMHKKLAGVNQREARLDVKLAKDDVIYRRQKKADEAVPVEKTMPSLKQATAEAEKAAVDESEAETARSVGEQTATLKKIEENTSILKDLPSKLAVPVAAAAATESGGGLGLGDVAGSGLKKLGGAVKRIGGNWLGKVGGVGKLAKGLGVGAVGALAGEGIQAGGEALREAGWEETGKAVNVAGTATKYAGYGAMIGSVVPGVGTAIGAGVGGLIGAGKGIYDQYFGDDSKAKPVAKAPVTYEVSGVTSDEVRSHPNYQKYYEQALNGRTGPDAERMARKSAQIKITSEIAQTRGKRVDASAAVPTAATPQVAETVYNKSGENVAAAQKGPELGSAPVIVNAPSTVNNTSNYGPKSPARNTDSSIQQYNRSKYAMST